MSCKYANILGVPGKGAHSIRFAGFAIVDIALTVVLAIITALITKTSVIINIVVWFAFGEILHYVFGTQTAFLTFFGIHTNCKKNKT